MAFIICVIKFAPTQLPVGSEDFMMLIVKCDLMGFLD